MTDPDMDVVKALSETIAKLHRRAQKDEGAAARLDLLRANMERELARLVERARYAVENRRAQSEAIRELVAPWNFRLENPDRRVRDPVELVRRLASHGRSWTFWDKLMFLIGRR